MATELELRYAVDDTDEVLRLLDRLPMDGGAPARDLKVEDRYLDTAAGAAAAAGWGVRIRSNGRSRLLYLKRETGLEGTLHRRDELEGVAGRGLKPGSWPDSEARTALQAIAAGEPLEERFRVRQQRHVRQLRLQDGVAEASLDRVRWLDGSKPVGSATFLEVELREGDEAALQQIADEVDGIRGIRAEPRSKELIGRVLVSGPGVTADDDLAEAGRKVMRLHLYRLLVRSDGVREGREPEEVHRMRVATRRLRAAWRTFGALYRKPVSKRQVNGLRTLARSLGGVRDLDVLLEDVAAHAVSLPEAERPALEVLADEWRRERDEAREALLERLASGQHRRWVEEALELVGSPGAFTRGRRGQGQRLVRDTAGSRLLDSHERVRAYEAVLPWADPATFHALRIEGKRLRYTIEFFAEPLGAVAEGLAETVTAMQDELGAMNDAHVAAARARDLLVRRAEAMSPAERVAVAGYFARRERDALRRGAAARATWRAVAGARFRQRLARAIAGL